MAAECREGIPAESRFDSQLRSAESPRDLVDLTGDRFVDRWAGQIHGRVLQRARVAMFSSGLTEADLKKAFLIPAEDIEVAVTEEASRHGPGARVAVLPHGPQSVVSLE